MDEILNMDAKADYFWETYKRNEVPTGGMAFREELRNAALDDSYESLDRIEQMLARLYSSGRLLPAETWWSNVEFYNFLLMLSFYLGRQVSRGGQTPLQWCNYEEAQARNTEGLDFPRELWSSLVGHMRRGTCVPLGILEAHLNGSTQMGIRAYVERLVKKELVDIDENARCKDMLNAQAKGKPLLGDLGFRSALTQANLDYTLQSLSRLDQLLVQIRQKTNPEYEQFLKHSEKQNFVRFVAFYAGMCTARVGGVAIKWLNFNELEAALPGKGVTFEFATSCTCLLDGKLFFPLGLITEILFDEKPTRSLRTWADGVLKTASAPMRSILRTSATFTKHAPVSADWTTAAKAAGKEAAFAMFMVEGGQGMAPRVLVPDSKGTNTIRDFSMYGTAQEALGAAQALFDNNPDKADYQVMSTDNFINLSTGRTDSIMVELRCYPGGFFSKRKALDLTICCPYRNAKDSEGFAIYSPKLIECSESDLALPALFYHFYLGLLSFKINSEVKNFTWLSHLDETI